MYIYVYEYLSHYLNITDFYISNRYKIILMQVEGIRDLIQLIAENTAIVRDLHNNVLSYTNKGKIKIPNVVLI